MLLIVPVLVAVLACLLRAASGPFWLATNSDPSYLYLFNALYILDGIPPMFTDHPGMPLQMLMAGLIRCAHPLLSGEDRVLHVAANAEVYLHLVWAVLIVFFSLSSWWLGCVVRKRSGSLLAAIGVQLTGLFFLLLAVGRMPVLATVAAEPMLAGLMNIFMICLAGLVFPPWGHGCHGPDRKWQGILGIACAASACVTTKLTFLPLILLPLFFMTLRRHMFLYLAGVMVFGALWALPMWPRTGKFLAWVKGLIIMTGAHGSGAPGLGDPFRLIHNLADIILKFGHLFVLSCVGIFLAFVRGIGRPVGRKPMAVLSFFILFQFLFVLKQGGEHYMAPAVGLSGLLLSLVFLSIVGNSFWINSVNIRRGFAGFIVVIVLATGAQAVAQAQALDKVRQDLLGFHRRVNQLSSGCVTAGAYRSSSPGFALFFGHSMHYYEGKRTLYFRHYGKTLARNYGDVYVYDYWTGYLSVFGKDIPLRQAVYDHGCIMVQSMETDRFPASWWQEIDASGSGEKLFQLRVK